jgi:signal peptidase I
MDLNQKAAGDFGTIGLDPRSKRPRRKLVIAIICAAVVLAILFFVIPVLVVVFVGTPIKVQGKAMSPTLNDGDRILVSKATNLQRGDIVLFYYPEDPTKSFEKRIIGLPGELIDMDSDGHITINGKVLEERYVQPERNEQARYRWNQVRRDYKQIGEDSYFVMGDNRDASNDSRSWGQVPGHLIYAKYVIRYWAASN